MNETETGLLALDQMLAQRNMNLADRLSTFAVINRECG